MAHALQLQFVSHIGHHAHRLWLTAGANPGGVQLPAYNPDLSNHTLARADWRIPFAPRPGRFYPSHVQAPDLPAAQFRITEMDADTLTLDFNAAISHFQPTLNRVTDQNLPDGILQPSQLLPWAGMEVPLPDRATQFEDEHAFTREDESTDTLFYAQPRLIDHIDRQCRARLAAVYRELIPANSQVLDLMSSHRSHLPKSLVVTGLGMNREELQQNPALSDFAIQDLNEDPALPFTAASFDHVVISLSFEYLTRPHAVLDDIKRVLKPGGQLVISFSHRYFPTKAVKLWTEIHPMERVQWVIQLLSQSGYHKIYSLVERGLPRPTDDQYAGQFQEADPLFLIRATT